MTKKKEKTNSAVKWYLALIALVVIVGIVYFGFLRTTNSTSNTSLKALNLNQQGYLGKQITVVGSLSPSGYNAPYLYGLNDQQGDHIVIQIANQNSSTWILGNNYSMTGLWYYNQSLGNGKYYLYVTNANRTN